MDPITVVSVVGSCTHLALRATTVVHDFGRLRDKFRHVDRNVQMVVTQINAIKGVVTQLSQWLQQNSTARTQELLPEVSDVLACCTDLVSLIGDHVDKVKAVTGSRLKAGLAQMLGEDKLKDYQNMLQSQVQALSLLIQCLQLRTTTERKSFIQVVENNTTLIQGTFELNPTKSTSAASYAMDPTYQPQSERKDSAIELDDPAELRISKLAIEAPPTRDEYHDFLKDMPRPTAELKVGGERRLYTAKAPLVNNETVPDSDGDTSTRKGSGFGLRFLGKISRRSVVQFEKLTMPHVLLDWPQWHRQQRSTAVDEGKSFMAVLNSGLYTAVRLKHLDYIDELFSSGAKETAGPDATWTLIHHAVKFADERTLTLLLSHGVSPNIAITRCGAPLHYAAQHGNARIVQTLLAHGAHPNILDANTRSPLYFALRYLLAIDHANKQSDPAWPFGKSDAARSAVCYDLRVGVRSVALLLHHGARTSSDADERRWRAGLCQKLGRTQKTLDLPLLVDFLADPLAEGVVETTVEVYLWIQHALKDSLREAARGSVSGAVPKRRDGSGKSVRFEEVQSGQRSGVKQQKRSKTADEERLEVLLGMK